MSEAKNLKNGDLINVNPTGAEAFKAKFIRYNSEQTSMQVFARGKMTFYPIAAFAGMLDSSKPVEEILGESKAKMEKKESKEVKEVKKAEPKKDLSDEAENEMKTKEQKRPAIKAEKAPAIDRSDLIKKLKKAEQTPKQIMKETGASKTAMIAAMLMLGIAADEIKKDLGLTITQFVYNIRAKLYAAGELKKA